MNITDTAKVSVEIVLVHSGVEYTFLRTESYVCTDLNKVKLQKSDYSVWYTEKTKKSVQLNQLRSEKKFFLRI